MFRILAVLLAASFFSPATASARRGGSTGKSVGPAGHRPGRTARRVRPRGAGRGRGAIGRRAARPPAPHRRDRPLGLRRLRCGHRLRQHRGLGRRDHHRRRDHHLRTEDSSSPASGGDRLRPGVRQPYVPRPHRPRRRGRDRRHARGAGRRPEERHRRAVRSAVAGGDGRIQHAGGRGDGHGAPRPRRGRQVGDPPRHRRLLQRHLYVFSGSGAMLWAAPQRRRRRPDGGQHGRRPVARIATTAGVVVDWAMRTVQWTRPQGFGMDVEVGDIDSDGKQELDRGPGLGLHLVLRRGHPDPQSGRSRSSTSGRSRCATWTPTRSWS